MTFVLAGISGLGTIGEVVFMSSKKEKEPKSSQEFVEPIKHFNSNKPRKHKAREFISENTPKNECAIYWVEDVSFNGDTSELGFDRLKGRYSNLTDFFAKVTISEDAKRESRVFTLICESGSPYTYGYYYLWKDNNQPYGWMRHKGGKLDDNIQTEN